MCVEMEDMSSQVFSPWKEVWLVMEKKSLVLDVSSDVLTWSSQSLTNQIWNEQDQRKQDINI